ncbi:hypothetical protein BAUCODRAFT_27944 [Baudoinia panamericana UAMH 10762]|uniref:Uncharacterized protein n=1 Tax=Baudoinia panamericana (strain UAMH 10762) TaxID=717646 RepID=M2LCJ1_BAUPA|nr:uncharacterized protein BAUCODRAFT_27944 [Baudoinia panamericana UAMH 10762]EMC91672.1 hypothetical protein BAUCODRAFT_27944 [Baudoinia panamericana UAMH 10762]
MAAVRRTTDLVGSRHRRLSDILLVVALKAGQFADGRDNQVQYGAATMPTETLAVARSMVMEFDDFGSVGPGWYGNDDGEWEYVPYFNPYAYGYKPFPDYSDS